MIVKGLMPKGNIELFEIPEELEQKFKDEVTKHFNEPIRYNILMAWYRATTGKPIKPYQDES